MFKVGDKVRFLRESINGVISRIIDHQLVAVTDQDGFEIPVSIKEIVPISPDEGKYFDKNKAEEEFLEVKQDHNHIGIFIAFVKDDKINNLYRLFFINNTDFDLLLSFSHHSENNLVGQSAQILPKNSFKALNSYNVQDFEKWPKFNFQILFHSNGIFSAVNPFVRSLKIKSSNFYEHIAKVPLMDTEGPVWQLDEQGQGRIFDLGEKIVQNKKVNFDIFIPAQEIDLHIEALRDDWNKMPVNDIYTYQLNYFHKCFDAAIANNFQKIIFIHGIGNGTLRNEIHKVVSKHPSVKTYKDAQKDKFGYGATEVIFS